MKLKWHKLEMRWLQMTYNILLNDSSKESDCYGKLLEMSMDLFLVWKVVFYRRKSTIPGE